MTATVLAASAVLALAAAALAARKLKQAAGEIDSLIKEDAAR